MKLPGKHFAVALTQCFGYEQELSKQSANRPTNHGEKHIAAQYSFVRAVELHVCLRFTQETTKLGKTDINIH